MHVGKGHPAECENWGSCRADSKLPPVHHDLCKHVPKQSLHTMPTCGKVSRKPEELALGPVHGRARPARTQLAAACSGRMETAATAVGVEALACCVQGALLFIGMFAIRRRLDLPHRCVEAACRTASAAQHVRRRLALLADRPLRATPNRRDGRRSDPFPAQSTHRPAARTAAHAAC